MTRTDFQLESFSSRWESAERAVTDSCFSWCCAHVPKLEQFEAERLDLRDDAEQRGPVLENAGEHRVATLQLGQHRRKRR